MRPAEEKKGTLREKRFVDLLPDAFWWLPWILLPGLALLLILLRIPRVIAQENRSSNW